MEAVTRVRGKLAQVRDNPRLAVAIAVGVLIVLAWIGWAIYVTSEKGGAEGVGVLIAWPALLAAAALVSLPFVAAFFLIRRRRLDSDSSAPAGEAERASGNTSH